jgi:hypothetical protein
VPADPPQLDEGSLAEQAWWERVHRGAAARGDAGSKLRGDWSHEMLRVQCPDASGFGYEIVDGREVTVTPEMFTEEYQQAECRRLCDQLGRDLGVGPMP